MLETLTTWSKQLEAEPGLTVAGALIAILLLVLIRLRARTRTTQFELAEIKGRLAVMAEIGAQQSTEQSRSLNDRIDTLARNLGQTLDTMTARLGVNLTEANQRTSDTLTTLNERLALIDEARRSFAELSKEVGALQGIFSNKQARGAFGQVRMETIIRDALPTGSFEFQPALSNGRRPDCIIRLPNTEAVLVVDSKFPLEGFEALRVARTPDEVKQASQTVRQAVRHHIDDIAHKYLIPGETQDTALMFVPSESICAEIYETFPDLIQAAHRAHVMIVAPNILMVAVHTIQAMLKDARMRDHADAIQREVAKLLEDVSRLVGHVTELKRHFGLSGSAVEKIASAATRIADRGERLGAAEFEDPLAAQGMQTQARPAEPLTN
jgi:DNA recombination protein RmuC